MFFTRAAKILAWLAFLYGSSYTAYFQVFSYQKFAATGQFLSEKSAGNFAAGLIMLAFGVVLGAAIETIERFSSPKD